MDAFSQRHTLWRHHRPQLLTGEAPITLRIAVYEFPVDRPQRALKGCGHLRVEKIANLNPPLHPQYAAQSVKVERRIDVIHDVSESPSVQ